MADQDIPEEIQDYYQTEKRERAGVAWLLAFGTLIVTIVLAGGIFFGGRWAYRKVFDTESNQPQEIAQEDQQQEERAAESDDNADQPQQSQQEQTDNSAERNSGRGGDSAVQGQESSNNTDVTSGSSSGSTPTTGDDSGDLPGTGAASTISVFFAVSILGYIVHRLYLKATESARI